MMNAGDVNHKILPGLQKMQGGGLSKASVPTLTSSTQPKSNLGISTNLKSGTYKPTSKVIAQEILKKQQDIANAEAMADRYGVIRQATPKRSAASKAWAIATNPMTALSYKAKGLDIPENFERGSRNSLDMAVDMVNPFGYVNAVATIPGDVASGDIAGAGLKAATLLPFMSEFRGATKGIIPKINPWSYQNNLPQNVMYRGIGKTGMEDALQSGVFRANPNVTPTNIGNFNTTRQFSKAYFSPKFNVADQYGQGYIAEVPVTASNWGKRYGKKDWSQIAQQDIPVDQGRILKKHWLQGYKEVPTVYTDIKSINRNNLSQYVDMSNDISGKKGQFNLGVYPLKKDNRFLLKVGADRTAFAGIETPNPANVKNLSELTRNLDPAVFSRVIKDIDLSGSNPKMFGATSPSKLNQWNVPSNQDKNLTGTIINRLEGKELDDLTAGDITSINQKALQQYIDDLHDLDKRGVAYDTYGDNFKYDPNLNRFKYFDLSSKEGLINTDPYPYTINRQPGGKSLLEFDREKAKNRLFEKLRGQVLYDVNNDANIGAYSSQDINKMISTLKNNFSNIKKEGGEPCYECGGMYAEGGYYDCPDQEKDPVTGKCKAEVVRGREANAANKAAGKEMNAWAKQVAAMDKELAKQYAAQDAGQLTFDYDWMQTPLDKADKKAAVAGYKQFFQQNPNVFVADDTSGYSPEQKYIIASKLKQRMSTPMGSKLVQQKYGVDPRFYDLQRIQSDFAPKMGGWDGMRNFLFNTYKQQGGQYDLPQAQWGSFINPVDMGLMASKVMNFFGLNKPKIVRTPASAPKRLSIRDPRKVMMTTGKPLRPNSDLVSGEYDSEHLGNLLTEAKRRKMSYNDMMNLAAMGFQETKWGKVDDNIGHTKGDFGDEPMQDSYSNFINAYNAKMKDADRLKIKDEATRLQVYNGLGKIFPSTEARYHGFNMKKIYGVPVPKEGINLRKNPLYGKQVMDIRDNVLKRNPEFMRYMDSTYRAPIPKEDFANGGSFNLPKMQMAGQNNNTPQRVSINDPRYAELYKNRQVGSYYDGAYSLPDLPEVTVTGKDERIKEGMSKGSGKFYKGLAGVMSAPQVVTMELLTGKQQTPSQAWGFDTKDKSWYHPKSISNFAMDTVLDPLNALGVGIADDVAKGTIRLASRNFGKGFKDAAQNYNPANLKTDSGLDWSKKWYSDPETIRRKKDILWGSIISSSPDDDYIKKVADEEAITYMDNALNALDQYKPKNYIDLLKDKGLKDYTKYALSTSGLSYGKPDQIYVNRYFSFPFNNKAKESTRVHELSHLVNENSRNLDTIEKAHLLRPFKVDGKVPVTSNQSKYYTEPTEIKARMDQARFKFGLKPSDKFTESMYDTMLKENNFMGMGQYIKDKNKFIDLMNNFWAAPAVGAVGAGSLLNEKAEGGPILDPRGQWAHPGKVTRIPGSDITMQGVPYPVYGVGSNGQEQMMYPEQEYNFGSASYVDEYPMMQSGGSVPVIEDAGNFNEEGVWIPDHAAMAKQAKKLGARKVKTRSGSILFFDKNWNITSADDNPMMRNGGGLLSKSVTCSNCGWSWKASEGGVDPLTCHKCGGMVKMKNGGYTVTRSNDRKGKTHKVTGPGGVVKYFGDSKLGQHPKDPERKAAFYARHKKNLDGNPFFRAFARKTWQDGGQTNYMQGGGLWNTDKVGYLDSTVNANRNLEFIRRAIENNGPSISTPKGAPGYGKGMTSSHLMTFDPKSRRSYPELVNINGTLKYLTGDDAYNYAEDTGEYIQFPTAEQADYFSQNYKKSNYIKVGKQPLEKKHGIKVTYKK